MESRVILFLAATKKENYLYITSLGFPVNLYIQSDYYDVLTDEVLLACNRIAIDVTSYKHREILDTINKMLNHGIDVYIVTEKTIPSVPLNVNIIPYISGRVTKTTSVVAIRGWGEYIDSGRNTFLITNMSPTEVSVGKYASSLWGVSINIDGIIGREDVLLYKKPEEKFEWVSLDEFISEHAGRVVKQISNFYGLKSLMATQFYRFYHEAKSGLQTDRIDAALGFSVINLYIPFEL